MVIAIESAWRERVSTVPIYRYRVPVETFEDCHDHGVFVSRSEVAPLGVESVRDLWTALADAEVEVRICPSLVALGQALIGTSLHWSLIRMRNAEGWEGAKGTPTVPR